MYMYGYTTEHNTTLRHKQRALKTQKHTGNGYSYTHKIPGLEHSSKHK